MVPRKAQVDSWRRHASSPHSRSLEALLCVVPETRLVPCLLSGGTAPRTFTANHQRNIHMDTVGVVTFLVARITSE